MTLDELRQHLNGLDKRILELVAERQRISREIASAKRSIGKATRDYNRERDVILRARANAQEVGIPGDVAEQLLRLLIRSSLTTQEQLAVAAQETGTGRRALVIGGAGKMGGWFLQFLASQGFSIEAADPKPVPGVPTIADWRHSALDHDLIVVATPLGQTNAVLAELAARKPQGIVFDVGSLKSPLRTGLTALRDAGVRVTSIHPMFGPDTELLSGRHVIFIDLGVPAALEAARALFAPTMAEQVTMSLDEHDRLVAYVLGLAHALNIAFFTALAQSGEAAPRLVQLSSTTFDAQFDIASKVAEENADMYYEIQNLNDYGADSLNALSQAVETIRETVLKGDRASFVALMKQGHEYVQGRRQVAARRA